jgi:hypothetical protein
MGYFVRIFYLLIVFSSISAYCFSINLPDVIVNTTYTDQIKTVQLHPVGNSLSAPVITLKSDQYLKFSFDFLTTEAKDFRYTIFHCDRNWKLSSIPQQEYLDSFSDFPIDDYAFSINTKVKYINYMLTLPNNDIPIKLSGNYVLVVFDRNNPDEPLITRRFYVVEQIVGIDARIRKAFQDEGRGENQEIRFRIEHGNFQIKNPRTDIKVVVTQNERPDHAIEDLKPLFTKEGLLDYDYDMGNTFPGANEFRFFEFRTINFPGTKVADISFHQSLYHITLEPDGLRAQKRYVFYNDINGRYRIEGYRMQDPDVEADYMFVHFTLKMDQVLSGGGVYVFGALSNWQCSKSNEMIWNMERGQYELSMLLKQGYYNYAYAWKDFSNNIPKMEALEGNHSVTENDYALFVYHGRNTDRYDRLIGYATFNSLANRVLKN